MSSIVSSSLDQEVPDMTVISMLFSFSPWLDIFRLTSYPKACIVGSYVYPTRKRTIGIAAGHTGSADPPHADFWIAAWARNRTRHPGDIARRAAGRAWRSLPRTSAAGRARLDLREVGSFFQQP